VQADFAQSAAAESSGRYDIEEGSIFLQLDKLPINRKGRRFKHEHLPRIIKCMLKANLPEPVLWGAYKHCNVIPLFVD
jgi:hypothetical protein